MKKFTFFLILLLNIYSAKGQSFGQFIRMPLAYPTDAYYYSPESMSIVDHDNLWVATIKRNSANLMTQSYYQAAKTSDGGNSWQSFQIPATGTMYLVDVEAQSKDVCYYFLNNIFTANSEIWKTTNGGITWAKKTTSEFSGTEGDFIHLFSNDTLIAVGDPLDGYPDIQLSNDGGETWSRVPQLNIDTLLNQNETGYGGKWCSAIGNTIWVPTTYGRCYKSIDRGHNWTVSNVDSAGGFQPSCVCFSDEQHGIFYGGSSLFNNHYYKTDDGGATWTSISIFPNTSFPSISNIEGIYDGFILATSFSFSLGKTYIYYTDDLFNTINVIDSVAYSNKRIFFKDAGTGWLGGINMPDSSILKFTDVLTSIRDKPIVQGNIIITPNPTSQSSLVTFPYEFINENKILRVFSVSGKLMKEYTLMSNVKSIELNAAGYSNGVYAIELISNKGQIKISKWVIYH